MKKLWDLKNVFSNLELEGQGRGIIMGVTGLLLLGPFYSIQTNFMYFFAHDCMNDTNNLKVHNFIHSDTYYISFVRVYYSIVNTLLGYIYHICWVTWLRKYFFANFQNNLLPSGEKSLVAKSLVIESVDRHEAGIYICEAKNGVGHKSATASIKLQVLCKFSMPFSATLVHYDRIFKFIFNYFQL